MYKLLDAAHVAPLIVITQGFGHSAHTFDRLFHAADFVHDLLDIAGARASGGP